jgi:hypothetical protein
MMDSGLRAWVARKLQEARGGRERKQAALDRLAAVLFGGRAAVEPDTSVVHPALQGQRSPGRVLPAGPPGTGTFAAAAPCGPRLRPGEARDLGSHLAMDVSQAAIDAGHQRMLDGVTAEVARGLVGSVVVVVVYRTPGASGEVGSVYDSLREGDLRELVVGIGKLQARLAQRWAQFRAARSGGHAG